MSRITSGCPSVLYLCLCLLFLASARCSEEPKKKILICTVWEGSHIRQTVENIRELVLTNKYNISMLFLEGSYYDKGFEGLDFNPIYVKGYTQGYMDDIMEYLKVTPDIDIDLQIRLLSEILNFTSTDSHLLQFLKEQQYDMLLTEQLNHYYPLRALLGIEKHFVVMLDPYDHFMLSFSLSQYTHTAEYAMSTSMLFGTKPLEYTKDRFTFGQRLKNQIGIYLLDTLQYFMWYPVMESQMAAKDAHYLKQVKSPDFMLAKGIEGLTTQIPLSPNQKCSYPLVKSNPGKETEQLSENLRSFVSRSQKIMLISFGTTFLPNNVLLKTIFSYIVANTDYSYIISFDDKYVSQDLIQMIEGQDHIFSSNWVPQKQLLQNEKVKVFFTHGGYNSFVEAIEFGTSVLCYPLAQNDQGRFCEIFQEKQFGQCLTQISFENIHNALKVIESKNYYNESLSQMAKVIEKKKEEEEDMLYWIDYVFSVDTFALNPEQYSSLNVFKKIDLDIKLLVIVPLLLTRFALMALCKKYCCKKKSEEKKK